MKPSLVHHLGTVALVAVMAVGCSKLPTEPVVGEAGDLQTATRGDAAVATVSPAAYSGQVGEAPVSTLIDVPTSATRLIHGRDGGRVGTGVFRIVVPPGAWNGNATVTVSQADLDVSVVELGITPAIKNNFDVPVKLVVDLRRVNPASLGSVRMSELNPTTGQWSASSGAVVDSRTMTMTIPLSHFSSYRVEVGGQVGW